MASYYSTFITGLQEVIEVSLGERLEDMKIELLLDGLVVYRSNEAVDKIKKTRFFNNTFLLLQLSNAKKNYLARDLIKDVLLNPEIISKFPRNVLRGNTSFRVIASEENQFVSVDRKLLKDIEALLVSKLRLKVSRSLPDLEIWFLVRDEGYSFVGLRITKTPNYEKTLHKGELRPELAHIMCLLAELKPSDAVLDPFAGYGAIPMECAKTFSVRQIVASEKNKGVFKALQKKMSKTKQKVVLGKWDALKLSSLPNNSVDKIITDPPWGLYDNKDIDLRGFYKSMLEEFILVLKPKGLMIILMAQKKLFEEVISSFPNVRLLKKYDILVSGKKSAIYKIRLIN